MPSKSTKQRSLMRVALSVKRKKTNLSKLSPSLRAKVRKIVNSMSEKQIRDFARA